MDDNLGSGSYDSDGIDSSAGSYFTRSLAPIHILLFILPLILIWEIGARFYLVDPTTGDMNVIRAWNWQQRFFETFGAVGRLIPAITLVTILLAQLIISKQPTKPKPVVLLGMVLESCLWAVPLLIMFSIIAALTASSNAPIAAAQASNIAAEYSWQQWTIISVGAGVYEEMLFRMALMPVVHIIVSDLFRVPKRWGMVVAVLISAIVFALYHDVTETGHLELQQFLFLCVAGIWFGIAYIWRGFGIAVGCHIAYDLAVYLPNLA